jgi:hypothetical protein
VFQRPDVELPPLLHHAAGLWLDHFRQEEFELLAQIRPLYEQLFPQFNEKLQQFFLRTFFTMERGRQVFNLQAARQAGLLGWLEEFDDMLEAVEDEAVLFMDESLQEAHDDGYAMGLWMLRLNGVPVEERAIPDDALAYLAAGAFAGVAWAERAEAHRFLARQKFETALRQAEVSGEGFEVLAEPTSRLQRTYRYGLDTLATNELYRARLQGQLRALEPYGTDVPMVWITAEDERVCPKCEPLHLTITDLVPVDDTHPDCRCIIVPFMSDYEGTVLPFETFLSTLERS